MNVGKRRPSIHKTAPQTRMKYAHKAQACRRAAFDRREPILLIRAYSRSWLNATGAVHCASGRLFIFGRFDLLDRLAAFWADAGRVSAKVVSAIHADAVFTAEFHACRSTLYPPHDNGINWHAKYDSKKYRKAAPVIVRGMKEPRSYEGRYGSDDQSPDSQQHHFQHLLARLTLGKFRWSHLGSLLCFGCRLFGRGPTFDTIADHGLERKRLDARSESQTGLREANTASEQ